MKWIFLFIIRNYRTAGKLPCLVRMRKAVGILFIARQAHDIVRKAYHLKNRSRCRLPVEHPRILSAPTGRK